MYKPFGHETIPEHLQGYRLRAKHICDLFPHYTLMTKEQCKRCYILFMKDMAYKDYNGPFK